MRPKKQKNYYNIILNYIMSNNNEEKTYYLSNISKITSLHPSIKEKYLEAVPSYLQRQYLENKHISDQTKLKGIAYFDKKSADLLEKRINTIKQAENINKNFDKYAKTDKKSLDAYKLYREGSLGGKRKKSRKYKRGKNNKTIKNR